MTYRVLAILLVVLRMCSAQAAEFCATTSSELGAALSHAENNGENDVIRIAAGTYLVPPVLGFQFIASNNDGNKTLTLTGGWTPAGGDPCGRANGNPWLTVLDGEDSARVLHLRGNPGSRFIVRLIVFRHGRASELEGTVAVGGGLRIDGHTMLAGDVRVERNVFLGNEAAQGGGLYVSATGNPGLDAPRVQIVNNLFLANHTNHPLGCAGAAAYLTVESGFDALFLTNNTIMSNTTVADNVCTAGGVYLGGQGRRYVANNILWGNDRADLYGSSGSVSYAVIANNLESRTGYGPHIEQSNITDIAPQFEPGLFSFVPKRTSVLVDAGVHPTPITQWPGFYLADVDLDGETRVVGGRVDIGAFENERIFRNGFQPSIF